MEKKQRHVKRYARKKKGRTVSFQSKRRNEIRRKMKKVQEKKIECNANLIQSVEKAATSASRSSE